MEPIMVNLEASLNKEAWIQVTQMETSSSKDIPKNPVITPCQTRVLVVMGAK